METNKSNTTTAPDLATILGDVLGDLAFLVGDDEHPELTPGAVWMECSISYSGPTDGTLRCWCTRDFAIELAANLLGLSPEDEDVLSGTGDALCEFMNVVCGQFVTANYGTNPIFDLSIPTVTECDQAPQFNFDENDVTCELSVSGEPFYCTYRKGRA